MKLSNRSWVVSLALLTACGSSHSTEAPRSPEADAAPPARDGGSTTTPDGRVTSAEPFVFADTANNVIRSVDVAGRISTVVGTGSPGYTGDGGPAAKATLLRPASVLVDVAGNSFIADSGNHVVRKVTAGGVITTVAGSGTDGYSGDGGAATMAALSVPRGLAVDASGNLFIADSSNNVVRRVTPAGRIDTIAGNGEAGYTGDGGPAVHGTLQYPVGVAVDGAGNVFIADAFNNVVRKVDASGVISTVAGTGLAGYSGDGHAGVAATLRVPMSLAVDGAGNLFIADAYNHVVRELGVSGTLTTVAGTGAAGYAGDSAAAKAAELQLPNGVTVDAAGDLFISDSLNNVVREIVPSGPIKTFAGNGSAGYSGDGEPATGATLNLGCGALGVSCAPPGSQGTTEGPFVPPTGFSLDEPTLHQGNVLYGATSPDANWFFTQWDSWNPAEVPAFANPGAHPSAWFTESPALSFAVTESSNTFTEIINANGSGQNCAVPNGDAYEFDMFISPDGDGLAYASAISPDGGSNAPTLQALTAYEMSGTFTLLGGGKAQGEACATTNHANASIDLIVVNKTTSPEQILWYGVSLSKICPVSGDAGATDCMIPTAPEWYWTGAVGPQANVTANNSNFGVADTMSSYQYSVIADHDPHVLTMDLLAHLKSIIASGAATYGMDPNLDHWQVSGVNIGQSNWGRTWIATQWQGFVSTWSTQ